MYWIYTNNTENTYIRVLLYHTNVCICTYKSIILIILNLTSVNIWLYLMTCQGWQFKAVLVVVRNVRIRSLCMWVSCLFKFEQENITCMLWNVYGRKWDDITCNEEFKYNLCIRRDIISHLIRSSFRYYYITLLEILEIFTNLKNFFSGVKVQNPFIFFS